MIKTITITETQERVYKLYQHHLKISTVAQRIGKSQDVARTIMIQLADKGLMLKPKLPGDRYKVIKLPYNVIPDADKPKKTMQFDVAISPEERAWMEANYKQHRGNRDEVVRILGRSRLEVNFMALQLGLAREG